MMDYKRQEHRLRSASVTFQKGLYHLFVLKNARAYDAFDAVLRKYQCVFSLGITQMLLDFKSNVIDQKKDAFAEKDPAAGVQHNMVRTWSGFESEHPLHEVSKTTVDIFNRVVNARHNLIYRPFFLDTAHGWYWEDCTLKELLRDIPETKEVEGLYKKFFEAMETWEIKTSLDKEPWPLLFKVFLVQKFSNSNKTTLAAYANLLNPQDSELEELTKEFAIQLLGEKFRERL